LIVVLIETPDRRRAVSARPARVATLGQQIGQRVGSPPPVSARARSAFRSPLGQQPGQLRLPQQRGQPGRNSQPARR